MKYAAVIVLIFSAWTTAHAQNENASQWQVNAVPQYLFNNEAKAGIQYRPAADLWIGLAPEYYFGGIADFSANGTRSTVQRFGTVYTDKLTGMGGTLTIRYFPGQYGTYHGFYFGGGFSYSQLRVSFQDNAWKPVMHDSLQYYEFDLVTGNLDITRYDGYLGLGRVFGGKDINVGFFAGYGQRYVHTTSDMPDGYRSYKRDFFDFQYDGGHPVLLLELGHCF